MTTDDPDSDPNPDPGSSSDRGAATDVDREEYRRALEEKRAEKDQFFADHPQSPIPPEDREDFDGLGYFEPDLEYRVKATVDLEEDPEADPVAMETTAGREVRYLRVATLTFDLDRGDPDLAGGRYELAAYSQDGRIDELFVPFRDKTTGQQSYRGGRYMELDVDGDLEDGQALVVDFNLAYSPFCAFSETFDCPLPPEENWLDVAIPAGEKTY
ncbi:DUF1684 domain-containing protein [Natronosalvus halobius]|uniref:DUF1684 domain-containing protein n=1 Tax=Natronosalvus halobius TaxID=2953746 RepID=UPI0020A10A21|nr:DUF1684 domain-containing protein [Natronosalvus halobius]USZ70683.1 DUF1684 domain-containing protein [Natronosalvus halobius]